MKRLLLFVMVAGSLAACRKSTGPVSPDIIGKWELHRRYGGNIYPPDTSYKPGNGNTLQFDRDSTYKEYGNGVLERQGIFHIQKNELYYDNNTSYKSQIILSGNMLTLGPLAPDISTYVYEKVQN